MIKIKVNRVFSVLLVLLFVTAYLSTCVSAEDTYLESLQAIKTQIATSEKNVRDDINSFNAAFKDTFRLVDDEISRLILANGAMVGVVFAIMFLVYAKTTSRTKRDLQVLLAAHAKHIDNVISTRLDEFESKIDAKMRARDTTTLSKLTGDFDSVITGMVDSNADYGRKRSRLEESKASEQRDLPEGMQEMDSVPKDTRMQTMKALAKQASAVEEAMVDSKDGKVKILNQSTSPLNRIKKRLRRGLLRLIGKSTPKEKVQEFKK